MWGRLPSSLTGNSGIIWADEREAPGMVGGRQSIGHPPPFNGEPSPARPRNRSESEDKGCNQQGLGLDSDLLSLILVCVPHRDRDAAAGKGGGGGEGAPRGRCAGKVDSPPEAAQSGGCP